VIARSTTFRFAALVFLFQIVGAAVLLLGLGALLRSQSRAAAVDQAETLRADLLLTYASGGMPSLSAAITHRLSGKSERRAVLFLADRTGKPLAGNLAQVPQGLEPDASYQLMKGARPGHAEAEAMFLSASQLPDGGVFVAGTVVEGERQVFSQLEHATASALFLALLFAGTAAFVSTRLIVNRLQATVTTLGQVREGDMSRRVPQDGTGDAFAQLGTEVNQALDRVASLNAELKFATETMAHDLKMPIARMQYALDHLARIVTEPEARADIDRAMTESERLQAMVETALTITRAEAGLGRESFRSTDVSEMLATITEIYAPIVEDDGRSIVVDAPPGFHMPLHRQLMDQAIGNLIDNTLKYGAGTITLSLVPHKAGAIIAVADEGLGIPEDRRAEAVTAFKRLDPARGGGGAGLGLSLVRAVAHLHGGTIDLGDCAPGLIVRIVLDDERA